MAANTVSFARHLRAANLSPKTQGTYLDALTQFAASFDARHAG